ncbi:hypothetical protein [Thiohalobacter sp. COW1]|uniref:hypothetical protein n=1 Tax=Thiohalobacter sp. COW1 TaxID=2795687 RepID=UPI001915A908|nr:hypothetical protein [Thiohalobacter sp. COW1]
MATQNTESTEKHGHGFTSYLTEFPSFRRMPESRNRCGLWIPACAGMTAYARAGYFDSNNKNLSVLSVFSVAISIFQE